MVQVVGVSEKTSG